jgi:hypothetical protein
MPIAFAFAYNSRKGGGLSVSRFTNSKICCLAQILTNIVGAVAESAKTPQNRETIRERGGLKPIIKLIASTSPGN